MFYNPVFDSFLPQARISKAPEIEIPRAPFIEGFNHRFIAFGSCFAGHLKRLMEPFGFRVYSVRETCFHFSSATLAEMLEMAAGQTPIADRHFHEISAEEAQILTSCLTYNVMGPGALSKAKALLADFVEKLAAAVREADTAFVTLGTARVTRMKDGGQIIASVNGLARNLWDMDLLSVEDNVSCLRRIAHSLSLIRMGKPISIVLTISPQRYLFGQALYGAKEQSGGMAFVDNVLSKSILRVACELFVAEVNDASRARYFPSYEIVQEQFRLTEPMIHQDFVHAEPLHTPAGVIKIMLQTYAEDAVLRQLNAYQVLRDKFGKIELDLTAGASSDSTRVNNLIAMIEQELDSFGPDLAAPLIHLRIQLHRRFGRPLMTAITDYPNHRPGNLVQLAEMIWESGDRDAAVGLLGRIVDDLSPYLSPDPSSVPGAERQIHQQASAKRAEYLKAL